MKRTCLKVAAVVSLLCSVGCCYRPAGINPYNGIAYGGRWEPIPGGPLDMTACCYGPNVCGPVMPMPGCCDDFCNPPCGMPGGPYMAGPVDDCCESGPMTSYPQTYVPPAQEMPHGGESVPGGGMRPVPDPAIQPKAQSNGGATTYVVPQVMPGYPNPNVNQVSNVPWVQAH